MTVYKHQGLFRVEVWKHGRRIYRRSGFKTRGEAERAERKALKGLSALNTNFTELCSMRLEFLKVRRSTEHYKQNYRLFQKLIKMYGKQKEISRRELNKYLNSVAANSRTSANKELRFIRALFNWGRKEGIWEENPAFGIELYSVDPKPRYVPPYSHIEKVLSVAKEEQRNYLLVLLHTMARVGEINNLRWSDIHKNYVILRTRKAKSGSTKETRVPINRILSDTLNRIPKMGAHVFINTRTGMPYNYRNELMGILCRKAGVPPFTFHALRHWGASKLLNEGVPISDIQALLGHERATTTSIYLRSINKNLGEAMKKLEVNDES